MIAANIDATPDAAPVFARTVFDIAAQVEAAETQIKQALIDAARAGDCDRVIDLVTRWQTCPSCEVLAPNGLANCSPPR